MSECSYHGATSRSDMTDGVTIAEVTGNRRVFVSGMQSVDLNSNTTKPSSVFPFTLPTGLATHGDALSIFSSEM